MQERQKAEVRSIKKQLINTLKKRLPAQQNMNEFDAYWRTAKFNDEWSGVNRICLQCKKGKAKKIENCKTTWCVDFNSRLIAAPAELPTDPESTSSDTNSISVPTEEPTSISE